MKKFAILALAALAGFSASAQVNVGKEVEKAFKSAKSYADFQAAEQAVAPMLEGVEIEGSDVYYFPGKAAYKMYDDLYGRKAFGEDVNLEDMGKALLSGYEYYTKALVVDTIVDAKGKVKTPHSKDIVNAIAGHFNDYDNTGSIFWGNQDWGNAYKAWTYYLETAGNPRLGKAAPAAVADTIAAQLNYWRAIAAWQAKMLPESAGAFDALVAIGFDDPQAYDYAYSVAYELKDTTRMYDYSKAGFDRFGSSNPIFLQRMINYFIQSNQYDVALNMLNNAIASEPTNPAYYYSLGVLYENSEDFDNAVAQYKKASELAPNDATYMFRYGNALARIYERDSAEGDNMSTAEYNKLMREKLRPELLKIAEVLEQAYALDNENMMDALRVLRNVYYNLNDGDNLKRVEDLML